MSRTRIAMLGAVAVAVAGATVAVTAPAGADVDTYSPPVTITIGNSGTIHARGAELTVRTSANCSGNVYGRVELDVEQARDGLVVNGNDYVDFICANGVNQVKLHVQPWGLSFQPGTAHVRARLYVQKVPQPPGDPVTAEADITVGTE